MSYPRSVVNRSHTAPMASDGQSAPLTHSVSSLRRGTFPPTLRKHPIGFLGGSGVWKRSIQSIQHAGSLHLPAVLSHQLRTRRPVVSLTASPTTSHRRPTPPVSQRNCKRLRPRPVVAFHKLQLPDGRTRIQGTCRSRPAASQCPRRALPVRGTRIVDPRRLRRMRQHQHRAVVGLPPGVPVGYKGPHHPPRVLV